MSRYWEQKQLSEMSRDEWEGLCDHCGKCCTIRLEDIDTGELLSTNIICKYFDQDNLLCQCYQQRGKLVPDCLTLTPDMLGDLDWLPSTCAYGLLRDGKPLPPWHPLITGNEEAMIQAGQSIQGRVISEYDIHPDDIDNFILDENW